VGDDLVQIEADWNQNLFYVRRGDDRCLHRDASRKCSLSRRVKTLWSYNGQWVLESEGDVIIDGQSQREQLGYEEMFGWQLINGQPFYFFKQNGAGLGCPTQGRYSPMCMREVQHYLCCEPSMFNPDGNNSMVWFYRAARGNVVLRRGGRCTSRTEAAASESRHKRAGLISYQARSWLLPPLGGHGLARRAWRARARRRRTAVR